MSCSIQSYVDAVLEDCESLTDDDDQTEANDVLANYSVAAAIVSVANYYAAAVKIVASVVASVLTLVLPSLRCHQSVHRPYVSLPFRRPPISRIQCRQILVHGRDVNDPSDSRRP